MTDEEEETKQEKPDNVRPIRMENRVVAKQLRDIADNIELGRTRGLFVVRVDEHHRPDMIALTEKYSVAELIGVIELELLKTKYSIVSADEAEQEPDGT